MWRLLLCIRARNGFHCVQFGAECIKDAKLKTIMVPKTGSIVPWYKREYYIPDPEVETRVVCITNFTRKYLRNVYEIPPNKISLIYQGTEVDRFTSSEESRIEAHKRYPLKEDAYPVLASIGAMENRKGTDHNPAGCQNVIGCGQAAEYPCDVCRRRP